MAMIYDALDALIHALGSILTVRDTMKKAKAGKLKAIVKLQEAINETKRYIRSEGFESNDALSRLWLEVYELSRSSGLLPPEEARFLLDKSSFWSDPQPWLQNKDALTALIPTLERLEEIRRAIAEKL
jgi:hypothetical protein